MNMDESRLKEIQEYKAFYNARLDEDNTELGKDLIQSKINQLEDEEKENRKSEKASNI